MNKKFYLIPTITTSLITVSCNYEINTSKYNEFIDKEFDVLNTNNTNEIKSHNNIINKILGSVFKDNQVKKIEYINSQNKTNELISSFNKTIEQLDNQLPNRKKIVLLQEEIPKLRVDYQKYTEFEINRQKAKEIRIKIIENQKEINEFAHNSTRVFETTIGQWISKNWLFFLNNLNKFDWIFFNFVTINLIPGKAQEKSQSYIKYLEDINKFSPYKTIKFKDSYLEQIISGDESKDLNNTNVFYVKKNKLVLRLTIEETNTDNPKVKLSAFQWNFANLLNKTLSLLLISSVYHKGFIHQYTEGMEEFAQDMIVNQRYGAPGNMYPIIGGENIEKTS